MSLIQFTIIHLQITIINIHCIVLLLNKYQLSLRNNKLINEYIINENIIKDTLIYFFILQYLISKLFIH
jgi:hypothetical protein